MTSASPRSADPAARIGVAEVRLAALALLTLLVFYACWLIARPFVAALTWAAVLALVTHPMHRWIAGRVPHRNLAAGLAVGYWKDQDALTANWQADREWTPAMSGALRDEGYARWTKAVQRTLDWL